MGTTERINVLTTKHDFERLEVLFGDYAAAHTAFKNAETRRQSLRSNPPRLDVIRSASDVNDHNAAVDRWKIEVSSAAAARDTALTRAWDAHRALCAALPEGAWVVLGDYALFRWSESSFAILSASDQLVGSSAMNINLASVKQRHLYAMGT